MSFLHAAADSGAADSDSEEFLAYPGPSWHLNSQTLPKPLRVLNCPTLSAPYAMAGEEFHTFTVPGPPDTVFRVPEKYQLLKPR